MQVSMRRMIVAVALVAGLSVSAMAQESRQLSVQGTGEVAVTPDAARISTGVTTQAARATQALAENSTAMASMLDGLRGAGVAAADMQTGRFSINPVFSQPVRGSDEAPAIVGTRVVNQLTVVVRDLDDLGVVLDDMVERGADTIGGIQFFVSDDVAALEAARRAAVADAMAKAAVLAAAAGVELGPVISIVEGGAQVPQPVFLEARASFASAVPIAVGEETIRANVGMVFAITE